MQPSNNSFYYDCDRCLSQYAASGAMKFVLGTACSIAFSCMEVSLWGMDNQTRVEGVGQLGACTGFAFGVALAQKIEKKIFTRECALHETEKTKASHCNVSKRTSGPKISSESRSNPGCPPEHHNFEETSPNRTSQDSKKVICKDTGNDFLRDTEFARRFFGKLK